MLAGALDGSCEPQRLHSRGPVQEHDVRQPELPFGHGARLVEHDRRHAARALEDLRPLDQDPELRATAGADHQRRRRRQAEGARAGDDQDRDGSREGGGDIAGEREPASERGQREHEHDRNENCGDAVDEALDRSPAGLSLCDEACDLRERRLRSDTGRADDEPAVRVDRAARDGGARADVDGERFPRQQRLVDRGGAFFDDPVGGDSLTRPDDEALASNQLFDRDDDLDPVAKDACLLRPQLEQRANRLARPAACSALEVPAEQDQGGDHAGDLEVRIGLHRGDEDDRRPREGGDAFRSR